MAKSAVQVMEINTVVCGDRLNVMGGIPNGCVDLVVTSPPYNVRKRYGAGVPDEIPWPEWYDFIQKTLVEIHRVLRQGGVLAINVLKEVRWQRDHLFAHTWMDYDPNYVTHRGAQRSVKGKGRVEPVFNRVYDLVANLGFKMRESIIWVKGYIGNNEEILTVSTNYQMGCDSDPYLRGTAEMIILASKGRWYHDGGTGRRGAKAMPFDSYTKDVWVIPGAKGRTHPAPFPIEIPSRLIRLFVHRANTQSLPKPVVFDPFVGKGTTVVAAKRAGWDFYGCDINPKYVNIANQAVAKEGGPKQYA